MFEIATRTLGPVFDGMNSRILAVSVFVLILGTLHVALAQDAKTTFPVDYTTQIQPLLKKHCYRCHSDKRAESGLRVDSAPLAIGGGDRGTSITPGSRAESLLYRLLRTAEGDLPRMPLKGEPLTDSDVELLGRWIDAGAPAPRQALVRKTSDHWAFQPVVRPLVPTLTNSGVAPHAVDAFVQTRLANLGLNPSPQADRTTLIRRLSLDLLGIPPTPEAIDQFITDGSLEAYENLVERCLASPAYGERWARHWLDVARYADSDGYNGDAPRAIWMYRDWVIDALNSDIPFDQFTIEQIAGDLLPNATVEQKIATGFHRNTLYNREGGNDPEQYRVERIVDRVNTTGSTFLGLTIGCAECHSHKYDPISQREFYEFFAFFNNSDEPVIEFPTPEEEQLTQELNGKITGLQKNIETAFHSWTIRTRELAKNGSVDAIVAAVLDVPEDKRDEDEKKLLRKAFAKNNEENKRIVAEINKLKGKLPKPKSTLAVAERYENPRMTHVHIRGSFLSKGAQVKANVPAVLPPLMASEKPSRVDLARWLVSKENPLTARVTVNRIWQRYFGVGLVETENDFGTQGTPPTHPALLDWLAHEFMERGWSLKRLHRLIVTSHTYKQSSDVRPALVKVDADNKLVARQRRLRLPAEVVRDSVLAVSGLLSHKVGGPSVYPYQPPGVMQVRRSPGRYKWTTSDGEDQYRRGMYTHFWRTSPHPFLTTFDAPLTDVTCTRRSRSNTPLQALMLLNDPTFLEAARAFGRRILRERANDEDRLRHSFRLSFGRRPTDPEMQSLRSFLRSQLDAFSGDESAARQLMVFDTSSGSVDQNDTANVTVVAAWTAVARVLLNLDEFITRE